MIKAFMIAFSVCFLLGTWEGWDEKRKTTEDEFLLNTAVAHVQVPGMINVSNGGKMGEVEYTCNSVVYFEYDLASGNQLETPHPTVQPSFLSIDGLQRAFEGATGITLYHLARGGAWASSEAVAVDLYKQKQVVAAAVGAISGYYAGRFLTSRQRVPCDSPALIGKIRETSSPFSIRARREFFKRRIEGLRLTVGLQAFRVVDLEDRLNAPAYDDHAHNIHGLVRSMSFLRNRFSLTEYKPTSNEYVSAWSMPEEFAGRFQDHTDCYAKLFPGTHTFGLRYVGPYDPNDVLASFNKHIYSFDFVKLILILVLLGVIAFLTVLVVQIMNDKRNRAGVVAS
jgi:hypothetical protein